MGHVHYSVTRNKVYSKAKDSSLAVAINELFL